MKTILVTTDLSEESKRAFPVALDLARAFGGKITLLSVIEDPSQSAMFYAMDFPILPQPGIRTQVVNRLTADLQKLQQQYFSAVPSEAIVRETLGAVYQEIVRFADSLKADFIVLATHGRTGIGHLLIGSTAERVAREAHSPVIIVPTKQ